ncbi:MAG: DNA repair protein RecN [Lachnospiraceae bacterium]|jgi:DNA repair protein RecN (Recombination protein N)|nr:DNA repair protein RecN [Lachnospiraceae bacterium]
MLIHLRVQNIALIDEVTVDLEDGLNVLTGETGAGKSIILGAINLALGGRGSKELLRDPSRPAVIDLFFSEEKPGVLDKLKEMGIAAEDGEILISRRFAPSGRSTCQINQVMVTTQQVKQVAALLIDIHGQHEHQSLLDGSRHIDILDRFIPGIETLKKEMREKWDAARLLQKEWEVYQEKGKDRERLLSLMQFELDEIEAAAWKENEEEELKEERRKLLYSEKLQESCLGAYMLIRQRGREGQPALDALESALMKLKEAEGYDASFFTPYVASLEEQLAVLQDMAGELRQYGEALEAEPQRLSELEQRLDQIQHLQNKYGQSRELVMAYYQKTKAEQQKLQNLAQTIEELQTQLQKKQSEMQSLAETMTKWRLEAAQKIEEEITQVLATLQFNQPIFKISRQPKELSPKGADQILFQIRTNVGETLRPLQQIASGGEMSRVMLAIKTVLAKQDEISTLIFDEIDTGISGRTAQSVAEKMSRIALYHQVICVTHLPQIAALADCHMRIEKTVSGEHTATQIQVLGEEQVAEELARMLGGTQITAAVKENAAEMKALAENWKKKERA